MKNIPLAAEGGCTTPSCIPCRRAVGVDELAVLVFVWLSGKSLTHRKIIQMYNKYEWENPKN
jgi:hypothetical protein